MAIKVHGATVIDNSKHITVSGAQVDGTLLLPEAGLLQVSKDNGSVGQFGASDTELITIGNSSNSKNIILRSSGFADFKQVNVNQILKVGGDNVQIDPDGSATFTGSIGSGFHGINLNNVGSGVQNEAFAITTAPGDGGYTRKTTIYTDGSAIFAGSVDVAGLTVNGAPVTGDVDLSGYDTSAEVDAKIAAIPSVDLSGYDTSTEVDAKIAAIPSVDLSGYDTSAQVNAKIANLENALINGAPEALNTLVELSTALGDDANFATTVTNSLAGKADLSGATFSGNIKLGDNNRLKFGNGDDLQIYHDGNNSIIREPGAGQLYLEGGGTIAIRNTDQSTINASFHAGSQGQQLFHQGSKKFETTSTGINVTGNVEATYFMGNLSGNVLNSQGQVVIDVDNPDFGLPFSGGTMTGDIVMGSPAVSTIGIDGDATFAGAVNATYFIGDLSGKLLNSQGQVVIDADNPNFEFDGNLTGDLDVTGTGTFAGTVNTGVWPNNSSTSLGGGAYMARQDSGTSVVWKAFSGGTGNGHVTSQIKADGSATFNSDVTVATAVIAGSSSYLSSPIQGTTNKSDRTAILGINHHTSGDVFEGRRGDTNATTSRINALGNATFASDGQFGGQMRVMPLANDTERTYIGNRNLMGLIGPNLVTDVTYTLDASTGSATFAGGVESNDFEAGYYISTPSIAGGAGANEDGWKNWQGKGYDGRITSIINADGSAHFASHLITGSENSVTSTSAHGSYIGEGVVVNAIQPNATSASQERVWLGKLANVPKSEIFKDGSATFASIVNIGEISGDATVGGIELDHRGVVNIRPRSDRTASFVTFQTAYNGGGEVYRIKPDGSVALGGSPTTNPNIALNADGSATFAGTHKVVAASGAAGGYRHAHTNAGYYLQDDSGNSPVALYPSGRALLAGGDIDLKADGSATFAAGVDARNISASRPTTNLDVFSGYGGATLTSQINANGSATFTGTVAVGGLTVSGSSVDTSAQVDAKISALETSLTAGAPGALDTLNELAASLGDDANFAGTVTNALAGKANLSGATFAGQISTNSIVETSRFGTNVQLGASSTDAFRIGSNATGTLRLKYDGSATFAGGDFAISSSGNLAINRTSGTNDILNGKLNGSVTSTINADGSATFAGDLTLGSYNTSSNGVRGLFYTETAGLTVQAPAGTTQSLLKGLGGNSSDVKFNILADGSATFAGNLQSGSNPDAGANEGALIRKNGRIQLASNQGSTLIWSGYTVGVSSPTSSIKADGSATFAGSISSGFNGGTTNGVELVSTGYFNIRNDSASANVFSIYDGATVDANRTIGFKKDGSAAFAGPVAATGNDASSGLTVNTTAAGKGVTVLGSSGGDIRLKGNGSATFNGTGTFLRVDAVRTDAATGYAFTAGNANSLENAIIRGDGSASFAGTLDTDSTIKSAGSAYFSGGDSYIASGSTFSTDLVIGNGSGTRGMTIYSGTTSEGVVNFADGLSGNDRYKGQIKYRHQYNDYLFNVDYGVATNAVAQIADWGIWSRGSLSAKNGYLYLGDEDVSNGIISARESVGVIIDSNTTTNEEEKFYVRTGGNNSDLFAIYEDGNTYVTGTLRAASYDLSQLQELT